MRGQGGRFSGSRANGFGTAEFDFELFELDLAGNLIIPDISIVEGITNYTFTNVVENFTTTLVPAVDVFTFAQAGEEFVFGPTTLNLTARFLPKGSILTLPNGTSIDNDQNILEFDRIEYSISSPELEALGITDIALINQAPRTSRGIGSETFNVSTSSSREGFVELANISDFSESFEVPIQINSEGEEFIEFRGEELQLNRLEVNPDFILPIQVGGEFILDSPAELNDSISNLESIINLINPDLIDIIRISGSSSVQELNTIIASENIFQTTVIETQLIDDNLSPTDDFFPFQTNYDLGSLPLDGTPIIQSTFLEAGFFENDVYRFDLGQTSDLDIFLDIFDPEDDADLALYRDSNNNGELDFSDQFLDFSAAVSSDAIFYPEASADTYFAAVSYFDGGIDSFIEYDFSIFTF